MNAEQRARHGSRIAVAIWLLLIASVVMRGVSSIDDGGNDFRGYVEVGTLVLEGQDPYATSDIGTNTWPPLFSVLAVPLALASGVAPVLTMTVWLIGMLACLYGCLFVAIRLVYGRPLALAKRPEAISVTSAAALMPMLFTWRYVLQNVKWLQIQFLILLLVLAGLSLVARRRDRAGGGLVGLAAAIKVLPVVFVPYFAAKRWWAAATATVLAGVALTLAPALVFGPRGALAHTQTWIERTRSIPVPVDWGSHSLYAVVDRFVGHRVLANPELLNSDALHTASGEPIVVWITVGLLAALLAIFTWSAWRGGRQPASSAATVEFAMALTLIPLVSPSKSWTTYFIFLLLGYVILWRAAVTPVAASAREGGLTRRQRSILRWLLGSSVLFGALVSASVTGSALARQLQMLSVTTLSAVLAFAALAYLRRVMGQRRVWPEVAPGERAGPAGHAEEPGYQSFSTTGSR